MERKRPDFDAMWDKLYATLRPEMQELFRLEAEVLDRARPSWRPTFYELTVPKGTPLGDDEVTPVALARIYGFAGEPA